MELKQPSCSRKRNLPPHLGARFLVLLLAFCTRDALADGPAPGRIEPGIWTQAQATFSSGFPCHLWIGSDLSLAGTEAGYSVGPVHAICTNDKRFYFARTRAFDEKNSMLVGSRHSSSSTEPASFRFEVPRGDSSTFDVMVDLYDFARSVSNSVSFTIDTGRGKVVQHHPSMHLNPVQITITFTDTYVGDPKEGHGTIRTAEVSQKIIEQLLRSSTEFEVYLSPAYLAREKLRLRPILDEVEAGKPIPWGALTSKLNPRNENGWDPIYNPWSWFVKADTDRRRIFAGDAPDAAHDFSIGVDLAWDSTTYGIDNFGPRTEWRCAGDIKLTDPGGVAQTKHVERVPWPQQFDGMRGRPNQTTISAIQNELGSMVKGFVDGRFKGKVFFRGTNYQ